MVRRIALALAIWLAGAVTAAAQDCRLALMLALDVSSSVDETEYDLQRRGLAAALDAPEVRHAILNGAPGHVALAVFEWSSNRWQKLQLDWTRLRRPADIDMAVRVLATMRRSRNDLPTSMGPALGYAVTKLRKGPDCARRVIDVSGDGVHNHHYGPREAYRHFPFGGVTVNGLVILGSDPGVLSFYATEVLHGPGAFLMTANGYEAFRAAMTRKLYREINDIVLGARSPALPRLQ